jgi:hypothetical protein
MSKSKKTSSSKKDEDFDFLGKMSGGDMNLDINDPKLMKELKAMGWDEQDDMDIDPELAELENQIEKEEDFLPKAHHGKEMTEEEIANAKFDDNDLNDPELMAELDEAYDPEEDPVYQTELRIEQLKQQIETCKQNAFKEKQNGNKDAALQHLKVMKSLQVELETSEALLNIHKISQKNKNPKQTNKPEAAAAPGEDFDFTSIVSMAVLEHEKEMALKRKRNDIVDTLDMQIDIISNNIQFGILTQEAYVDSIQRKILEYKAIVSSGKDNGMYSKHIEIMEKELKEADDMDEDQEPPEDLVEPPEEVAEPPKPALVVQNPVLSHDALMGNVKYKIAFESLEEGKEAFKYLKNLGKMELCEKLIKKLEAWQEIIKVFQAGKNYSGEFKALSPIDITGYSEEERSSQFRRLIEFSSSQAAKTKELALAALKQKDKELASQLKRDMIGHENKAKELEEALKNPWQIPPGVGIKSFTKSVPSLNEDLEPGVLEINYGKASGLSDKENYIITYSIATGETLTGTSDKFSKVCEKGFNHSFKIKIEPRNFNTLFKKHITFEVFEHHLLRSNKSQGNCKLKLDALAKQCTLKSMIQLGRKGPQIEVTIRINKSLSVPEFKQIVEKVEYVDDLFVPFKNPMGKLVQTIPPKVQIEEKKIEEKKIEEKKTEEKKIEEKKSEPKTLEGNFDDIGQDEYENPNVVRNLISFEVLDLEIEKLKKIIVDLRSNGKNADKLITLQRELMKNKAIIEAQVENGIITPEQYKEVLQNQIKHDILLADFYKQRGKKEHLAVVVNRVKIMRKEVEELNNSE